MSLPPPINREKWIVLGMLWLVCLLNYADRQAISSLFPLLERDYGFTKTQLGLIGSAFMWVYAASAPFAGYAGDRNSRKGMILGGCLFWSLMTVVTGLCGRLWQFVASRALIGLGESVYFPAATSMLSDYHGTRTRSTALSLHQSAVYIGTIVGGGLGALLAERFGWRWAFYGFGAAGIVVSLLLWIRLREPARGASERICMPRDPIAAPGMGIGRKSEGRGFAETFHRLIRTPGVPMLLGAFACANGVAAIFMVWAPTFLFEKFHLSLVSAGFSAVVAIQLASAVSAPLSGMLADRLALSIYGARMLVQAVALILGSFCVVAVGHASGMEVLVCAMICFGLCKGAYDGGIFASAFDCVPPQERASVAGLMNLIGWGGGALGPLAIGLASSLGTGTQMERMSGAIAWSGAAYLVAAGLLLAALISHRKENAAMKEDQRMPH
jgi:MFS family permease